MIGGRVENPAANYILEEGTLIFWSDGSPAGTANFSRWPVTGAQEMEPNYWCFDAGLDSIGLRLCATRLLKAAAAPPVPLAPPGPKSRTIWEQGSVEGPRPPAEIEAVAQRKIAAIRYCHQREVDKDPRLVGNLTLRFTITPEGQVAEVPVATASTIAPTVESCVIQRVLRYQFPPGTAAAPTTVTWILRFLVE